MPDSFTPALGLTKPEVGASRDTWGTKLNANMDLLDQFVHMSMPIGCMMDFAGTQAPAGWLICDGRLLSRTTYSALFAVIGTNWGAGDGSTTFRLPNTPGRAMVSPGTVTDEVGATISFTFAQIRGAVARPIVQANLPAITMTSNTIGSHSHGGATGAGGNHTHSTDAQGTHHHAGSYLPDHAHGASAWTDSQGNHNHSVQLDAALGTGAAAGGYGVLSNAFGNAVYTTSVNGAHGHNVGISIAGAGNIGLGIYDDGNHSHSVYGSGNFTLPINADGNHSHTVTLPGSGTSFDIMSPVLCCTKIIYAGTQAATTIEGTAVITTGRRRLQAPARGTH